MLGQTLGPVSSTRGREHCTQRPGGWKVRGTFQEVTSITFSQHLPIWTTPGAENRGLNLTDLWPSQSSEFRGSGDEVTEEKLDQGGLEFELCSVVTA